MRRCSSSKRLLSLLLVLALSLPLIFRTLAAADSAVGATVQLAKTEGTVGVTNTNGRKATILKNMKLYNGYHVSTEEKSYAWINLDSTKLIKEDASSQVEVRESGKKLEVLLSSGNLFFNVTKDLEEEETLNIRTSTMVAGIRGTCGWVRVIDRWNTYVYILEGRVECRVADPVTGQIKSTILTGGEQANFVVYPQDREGDKCDILQDRFTEADIPGFVLVELVQDRGLCQDIYDDSGLDILGKLPGSPEQEAQRRLEADQAEAARRQEEISAQETRQEHNIAKDPVWKETPSDGGGSSGGGGGSSTPTPSGPTGETTLTMPVTVPQIIAALARYNTVNIVPGPGASAAEHTLTIDQALTVPAGQALNVADGDTQTSVRTGQTLQVDGTMHLDGNFTNEGSLNVTSGNTFQVGGEFYNEASGVINNTKNGRIVAEKGIISAGKINNADSAEITSGALYTVMLDRASDPDTPVVSNPVTGITGGWITNTNPRGGLALAWRNENIRGLVPTCDNARLRSATPNIMGYIDRSSGCHVYRPAGEYIGAPRNGYYSYQDMAGILSADTLLNLNGGSITNSLTPTWYGHIFQGWNTAADGSGTAYAPGTWPIGDENPPATVYAQWGNATMYTVTISGKVTDQNGNAIAGATVSIRDNTSGDAATTADDGSYSLTTQAQEGQNKLSASISAVNLGSSARGLIINHTMLNDEAEITIDSSKSIHQDLTVTVPDGSCLVTITGTVTDHDGKPFSGIGIQVKAGLTPSNTDASGVYTTQHLIIPGGTIPLRLTYGSNTWETEPLQLSGGMKDRPSGVVTHNIQLPPLVTVTGTVTGSDGNPAENVRVELLKSGPDAEAIWANYTDENGRYSVLYPLEVGTYVLKASRVTSETKTETVTVTKSETITQDFSFDGEGAEIIYVTFTGEVTDQSDNPLPDVEVKTDGGFAAKTDESGTYILLGSYTVGETITISASYDHQKTIQQQYKIKAEDAANSVEQNFQFVVESADTITLTISGKVTRGEDSGGDPATIPVSDAEITVSKSTPDTAPVTVRTATSDENGKYSCSITVDKDETITVGVTSIQVEGYDLPKPQEFEASKLESNDITVDFHLTPPAVRRSVTISGKVTDEQGGGVADAKVELIPVTRAPDDAQGLVISDSDGNYKISAEVPDGTYIVKATVGGRTVSCAEQIVIDESSEGQTVNVQEIKVGIAYELKDGVLTYTGCGATDAYVTTYGSPWSNNTEIKSIVIYDRIVGIGSYSFIGCTNLEKVEFIGDSRLKVIDNGVFKGCVKLSDITLPESMTTIGGNAFEACSQLAEITIPAGVTKINDTTFNQCTNLAVVNLPDSLTDIGSFAFTSCTSLKEIHIPDKVVSIGRYAFQGCTALTQISLPYGLTTIGEFAFSACSKLTRAYIPGSVTQMSGEVFGRCGELKDIYFGGDEAAWTNLQTNNPGSSFTVHYSASGLPSSAAIASLSRIGFPAGRLAGALVSAGLHPLARAAALSVTAPGDFADVSPDSWYAGAADYCRTAGLMNGTGAGVFDPEGVMTRAMVATVLHRLAGSPAPEGEETSFTDVAAGTWYAEAVLWAQESGVMNGRPDGRFDPDGAITREQLAAVLWRLAGSPGAEESTFADSASIAPYAARAAGWAGSAGIINGMPDGRFAPGESATRAQTARIMTGYVRAQGLAAACSAMDIMCAPAGAALMPDGSLLVTDTYNKVIWRVAGGVSTVYAGSGTVEDHCGQPLGGYNDAVLEESYFRRPWAIVPFLDGWAVSDTDNQAVRLISGGITQTVNGQTRERLTVSDLGVTFGAPTGLACDEAGNLYVADTLQNAIRKITPAAEVTTFAGGLDGPMGLCWAEGALYAAETGANRIVKITAGKTEVLAGSGQSGFADGPAAQAAFSAPQALAVDRDGAVYVADTANGAVRRIGDGQVTTLLRRDVTDLDSFAPVSPTGLLIRGDILYICDNFSRKLLVFPLK